MKWLVATTDMDLRRAAAVSVRPTAKWDWTWTTSGATRSSSRVTEPRICQGRLMRKAGWNGVRWEASRCTVTPSTVARSGPAPAEGQITWTSWPR